MSRKPHILAWKILSRSSCKVGLSESWEGDYYEHLADNNIKDHDDDDGHDHDHEKNSTTATTPPTRLKEIVWEAMAYVSYCAWKIFVSLPMTYSVEDIYVLLSVIKPSCTVLSRVPDAEAVLFYEAAFGAFQVHFS